MNPDPDRTVTVHINELADWAALLASVTHWLADADTDTIRDHHDCTGDSFTATVAELEATTARLYRLARQEPPR